jgi:hypothetical protein
LRRETEWADEPENAKETMNDKEAVKVLVGVKRPVKANRELDLNFLVVKKGALSVAVGLAGGIVVGGFVGSGTGQVPEYGSPGLCI